MDFCCPDTRCPGGGSPAQIQIPNEALMDEQNLATLFCPRCQKPLVRCPESSDREASSQGAI